MALNSSALHWLAPSFLQGVRAAFPAAAGLLHNRALPFSTSRQSPQQQQPEDAPEQETGLAFEEIYVDSKAAHTSNTSPNSQAQEQDPVTAVFLHGLLGSSRNWRSFSRKLAQDAAARINRDVRVLLVDLRCHGVSSSRYGFNPPHNMVTAANDVAELIKQQLAGQAPHLLVGLSLGGKVALQLLKQFVAENEQQQQQRQGQSGLQQQHLYESEPPIDPPEDRVNSGSSSSSSRTNQDGDSTGDQQLRFQQQQQQQQQRELLLQGLPQQVWVLDSQPGTVPIDVDAPTSVGKILQLINDIPVPLDNRQVLYKMLTAKGIPLPVAQWLGSSLAPGGRGGGADGNGGNSKLDWVFDVSGAAALYNSYRLTSYWDVFTRPPPGVSIHLVRGEKSDRWTPHMLQQLADAEEKWEETASEQPEAVGVLQMHVLERAGHWLQADNPEGLQALIEPWFRDLHQNRLLF